MTTEEFRDRESERHAEINRCNERARLRRERFAQTGDTRYATVTIQSVSNLWRDIDR